MKTRIEELLAYFEMSPSRFADELGIQRSGMSHILSGRNKPSLELMQKVLARFPEVSTDWLISGKGDMLNAPKQPVIPVIAPIAKDEPVAEPVKERFIEKAAEEIPVKEKIVTEKEEIKPAKPIVIAPKPVVQVSPEPQPEKMILPREQLALFDVPAVEQAAGIVNNPQAIYNIASAINKDRMNTDKPAEKPAASSLQTNNIQVEIQTEMAKAIATRPAGKSIERIVVFYSDKTFSAYSPE